MLQQSKYIPHISIQNIEDAIVQADSTGAHVIRLVENSVEIDRVQSVSFVSGVPFSLRAFRDSFSVDGSFGSDA